MRRSATAPGRTAINSATLLYSLLRLPFCIFALHLVPSGNTPLKRWSASGAFPTCDRKLMQASKISLQDTV
ncbi:hypothetical protein EMIT048CA2_220091 [Pseudomonas chlororaphis]